MCKTQIGDSTSPHVSICVCTYRRTKFLPKLLNMLLQQDTENLFTYSVVVVDNDILRSAENIVNKYSINSNIKITYIVERNKNIAMARNKAIMNSTGDLIAFIDDDELPERGWLINLYKALVKFGADAVLGPVYPLYQVEPPKWVKKGMFFQRPLYRTGFQISWTQGRTGNLLIKKSLFESTNIYFDPKFGRAGEDQELTRKMLEKGFKFIWCNEAPVSEIIPPKRWEIKNMIKTAFIRGGISSQHPGSKAFMMFKSTLAIFIYILALPMLIIIGYHYFVSYLIKLFYHIGKVCFIINKRYCFRNI